MALTFVAGGNFSGRSEYLRKRTADGGGLYLHPDLELNLSGLAETVAGEAFLHCSSHGADARKLRTLSGGERAGLVLDCALAQRPSALAIDCALEQLDQQRREDALQRLSRFAADGDVWLSDNRLGLDSFERSEQPAIGENALPVDFNAALDHAADALCDWDGAPIVRATRLSFTYRGTREPIFDNASFMLRPGAVHLLKAPNGAGKSTLARLLVGVLRPNSGLLDADGVRLGDDNRPFFYSFQNARDQIFGKTPVNYLEDVTRFGLRRKGSWPEEWQHAEALAAAFGLASFRHAEVWDLPPIALKRLGLAAAFASRAPWLFLDEPALGLDAEGRAGLTRLLARAAERGRGIIAVSHGDEFDAIGGVMRLTIAERTLSAGASV